MSGPSSSGLYRNQSGHPPQFLQEPIFSPELSAEQIGWWINNQHSDGIYADAPQPLYTVVLDEADYSITGSELIDQTVGDIASDEYDNYRVQNSVDEVANEGNFQLTGFEQEAVVHIRTEACGS